MSLLYSNSGNLLTNYHHILRMNHLQLFVISTNAVLNKIQRSRYLLIGQITLIRLYYVSTLLNGYDL